MRLKLTVAALVLLSGCTGTRMATPGPTTSAAAAGTVEVGIIALNDFHGALEPPSIAITATGAGNQEVRVPAGGAAYLASAVRALRERHPNNVTVSAGDLISASPLASALFLDEPTVLAMNIMGLDVNAVGNHEFDRGRRELLRMQNGGCERNTARTPCALDPFPGGRFRFLAANVVTEDGSTLFPPYTIRSFGSGAREVKIAFIGLTLRGTPMLVTPAGVEGLRFLDEADTINALIPRVRAEGADAIVVVIHQGLSTSVGYHDHSCAGVDGDLLPVLARLDSAVSLVVSGHTHNAYICDYGRIDPTRPFLVTSAGRYGSLLTEISLRIDPTTNRVVSRSADNRIVQSVAFGTGDRRVEPTTAFPIYPADPQVAALVDRYVAASRPIAERVVARLSAPALRERGENGESSFGDIIADGYLAATGAVDAGGAQIAFANSGGVRTDLVPGEGGAITYGQLFAAQPFGNTLTVVTLTGRQLRALLEQQFPATGDNIQDWLTVSRGFTYSFDLSRPQGQRVVEMRLNGQPIADDATYRVATNSFMASGGGGYTVFGQGTNVTGGISDLDALERYLASAGTLTPPATNRVRRLSPP